MSRYRPSYVQSHCIDVFFRYGRTPIHVLTDGNVFPVDLDDLERNRGIQREIALRESVGDVLDNNIYLNPDYSQPFEEKYHVPQQEWSGLETHLELFITMAKLGFHSYDCVEMDGNGRGKYVLVARPKIRAANMYFNIPEFNGIEPIGEGEDLVSFWM